MVYGTCQPENVFLTNSRYGEVDWQDVRLGDFGSSVEVALGGRTTLDGLQTRCGTTEYRSILASSVLLQRGHRRRL